MEILNQLNATQLALLTPIVVGITELYNRAISKDWKTVGKIVVAVITGTLVCMSFKLGFVPALAIAFAPSGVLTLVGSVGQKSQPTARTLTGKDL